nr:glycoside hydrolase family 25 protein [Pseudopedobacter sp.]
MPVKKTISKKAANTNRRKPKRKAKSSAKWKIRFVILILMVLIFSPFYYGKVLKTAVSTSSWFKDLFVFDAYPHYEKFGIRIPKKYGVHGIDVSFYQQKINWKKVGAMEYKEIHISFAFIKATEGVTLVDPYFQRNWRESKEGGIVRGAYHYFKPKKSGIWQARFFLQTVNVEAGDLPPVVDIEEAAGLSESELIPNIQDFLNEVEKKTKTKPIIYTGYQFYKDHLIGKFDEYPIWIAHYYQQKLAENLKWNFWQHSDKAHIDGIKGKVDMNVFNGEEEDLSKLLVQKVIQ